MTIAIFDLDYTLIEGDTEWLWGEFLTEKGIVGTQFMRDLAIQFQLYGAGTLDIRQYQRYLLDPLIHMETDFLVDLQREFSLRIRKLFRSTMLDRLAWHRQRGDLTVLVSATSNILVEPVTDMLNFSHRICTQVEMVHNLPTGELIGIPAYQEGKVQNLAIWLAENGLSLEGSWAYSDSLNDIPLLEKAEHPVAVTPDAALRKYAMLKGWRIMDL